VSFLGLDIAASGIAADQAELDNAAENLANIDTPGYARTSVELSPLAPASSEGVGEGVLVGTVGQQTSPLYEAASLAARAQLAGANESASIASTLQSAFPEPGGTGLQAQLSQTWTDLASLATNPSSAAAAGSVVEDLHQVATTLNSTYAALAGTATQLASDLTGAGGLLAQVNDLLSQVGQLNVAIVAGTNGGLDTNALVDQRREALGKLADLVGVRTVANADGSVDVLAGGITLVAGASVAQLQATGSPSGADLAVETTSGAPVPAGGQVGALLTGVDETVPGLLSGLSGVADSLATALNALQSAGVSADGTPGPTSPAASGWSGPTLPPIFVDGGSTTAYTTGPASAASIAVSPQLLADPSLLATASGSATAGQPTIDATTAQQMAALGATAGGPDDRYGALVGAVGTAAASATSAAQAAQSLADAAAANLSSVEGVSTNDETIALLEAQQAYQATAHAINAMSTAFNDLLAVTT